MTDARKYWNGNLDTDNLSRKRRTTGASEFEESLAFASTPEFEWLRRRADNVEGRLLIDLGGGVGMHAILWAQAGARVVVVDPALRRMHLLRRIADQAGLADRIRFVAAAAEALPLRSDSVGVVFTKSVLIHTDLPRAAAEIHRVLEPRGQGLFIEPLNRNPLIRLYRLLFAPRIWKRITRYFDRSALSDLRAPFGRLRWKAFYLASAWSFVWQYGPFGLKNLGRFQESLARWRRVDRRVLSRFPRFEPWSWFASIEVRKGE
ncbi:class I SAM-dependent methyltransferase [Candidatus Sumerlaeota bacterium]|nr:class I SAM-dependent methyltransferase [Candidatus Sumerlaeota bacterium]